MSAASQTLHRHQNQRRMNFGPNLRDLEDFFCNRTRYLGHLDADKPHFKLRTGL